MKQKHLHCIHIVEIKVITGMHVHVYQTLLMCTAYLTQSTAQQLIKKAKVGQSSIAKGPLVIFTAQSICTYTYECMRAQS